MFQRIDCLFLQNLVSDGNFISDNPVKKFDTETESLLFSTFTLGDRFGPMCWEFSEHRHGVHVLEMNKAHCTVFNEFSGRQKTLT